jgi:hypothetical protein
MPDPWPLLPPPPAIQNTDRTDGPRCQQKLFQRFQSTIRGVRFINRSGTLCVVPGRIEHQLSRRGAHLDRASDSLRNAAQAWLDCARAIWRCCSDARAVDGAVGSLYADLPHQCSRGERSERGLSDRKLPDYFNILARGRNSPVTRGVAGPLRIRRHGCGITTLQGTRRASRSL